MEVGEAYIEGLGTVRACLDCGCLVLGGPTRCAACADKAPPYQTWHDAFSKEESKVITSCAGLPEDRSVVIIERMAAMLDAAQEQGFRI